MLTLDAVDRLLDAWQERLRRIDESITALMADATYQTVTDLLGGLDRLAGATRDRVAGALAGLDQLHTDRELLGTVIDRARELRRGVSALTLWGKEEKLAEIEALLLGPSITLGTENRPLSQRSLLDTGPHDLTIEPDALLGQMSQRYERSRDALLSVGRAWRELDAPMRNVEARMAAIEKTAADLGVTEAQLDGLATLRAEVARVRLQLARDPLSVRLDFDEKLAPRCQIIESSLAALKARRDQVLQATERASELLQAVADASAAAHELWRRVLAEVAVGEAARSLLIDDATLAAHARAIDQLRRTGGWQHAGGKLDAWLTENQKLLERARTAQQRGQALLDKRAELGGRLSARRAQLLALAARGAPLDPGLPALADEIDALLRQRPTPVGQAASLLDALERAFAAGRRLGRVAGGYRPQAAGCGQKRLSPSRLPPPACGPALMAVRPGAARGSG